MNIRMDNNIIEEYLKMSYYIIDVLPKQVPATRGAQYLKIEQYFLSHPQKDEIFGKFINVLVKLNCYEDMMACLPASCQDSSEGEWQQFINPDAETLRKWMDEGKLFFVVIENADTMISISGDDHYMTIYNPDEEILGLIRLLVTSEGLFLWKPDV